MRDLTELNKFQDYLIDHMYSCDRVDEEDGRYDRHQVICSDKNGTRLFDAICHCFSSGGDEGLLEIYCPTKWLRPKDERYDSEDYYEYGFDVAGHLTADDCIKLIETHMTDEQRESITVSERGAFYEEIQ